MLKEVKKVRRNKEKTELEIVFERIVNTKPKCLTNDTIIVENKKIISEPMVITNEEYILRQKTAVAQYLNITKKFESLTNNINFENRISLIGIKEFLVLLKALTEKYILNPNCHYEIRDKYIELRKQIKNKIDEIDLKLSTLEEPKKINVKKLV